MSDYVAGNITEAMKEETPFMKNATGAIARTPQSLSQLAPLLGALLLGEAGSLWRGGTLATSWVGESPC